MAPIRVHQYQCQFCQQRLYLQRGRLNHHLKTKHPKEFEEEMEKLASNSARFTPPPAPVGTVPDGYERLIQLARPLTSLTTRITTTNQVDEQDYDSPDEITEDLADDPTGDLAANHMLTGGVRESLGLNIDLDSRMADIEQLSTAQHRTAFPGDILIVGIDEIYRTDCFQDIWKPFKSGYEFKLARWIVDTNLSKKAIDRFFNECLARTPPPASANPGGVEVDCFTSAYTLSKLLDDLDPDLNIDSWKIMAVDHVGTGLVEFRYRSVEAMVRSIFKQPSHEPYMVYSPVKEYDGPDKGYRLLSGIHTGDWWWRMQVYSVIRFLYFFLNSYRNRFQTDTLLFQLFLVLTKPFKRISLVTRIYCR